MKAIPPPAEPDGSACHFDVVWVSKEELDRYGYQSCLTPREIYRKGIASVNNYAQQQFGQTFAALSENQQESIVADLAEGKSISGFTDPNPQEFFDWLRTHTIEGMFADPLYGGNRDLVGWKLLGYPGAQRAYTPVDMLTEGTPLEPQSIAHLPMFNAGQRANEHVILPVSGSDMRHGE
jgi:gluconate 2-dehydrogenase gamma chain